MGDQVNPTQRRVKKVLQPFTEQEQKFIDLYLGGLSFDEAAKKAEYHPNGLRRGEVFDHILGHFGRLGVRWSGLVEKGKRCLEEILDDKEEKGATKVQAVKVLFWTLLQASPGMLKEEEELGTRDEAADKVLGSVMSFGSDKVN